MFTLALDYTTGIYLHAALLVLVYVVWFVHSMYRVSYNFVLDKDYYDDEDYKKPFKIPFMERNSHHSSNIVGGWFCYTLIYLVVALIASLAWPLLWPLTLTAAVLLVLRKWFRFKRSIKEALGNKAEKDHTHDESGNYYET